MGERTREAAAEHPGISDQTITALLRAAGLMLFAWFVFLGAQIAIPLPPDGVPMTFQTLAVVMAALCLGPRLGAASMGLYLLVGTLGAAVFADGGAGSAAIFGQTGGYLVGFVLCQPVITRIVRRQDGSIRGWGALIAAVLIGHGVIFLIGVPWLAVVRGFSLGRAIEGGFVPFVPGLIVKSAIAVYLGRLAAPWAARRIW
ncbi:MAG: biotin transporter BioY [Phycisphaerales bacterium]